MERKIGEIFEYKGKIYKVSEQPEYFCAFCDLEKECSIKRSYLEKVAGTCSPSNRNDARNVCFKEIKDMEIKDNKLTINIPEGMEIDTFNQVIDEVNKLEVIGDGVVESTGSAFTISDLLHVLVDYVDDGMGYLEVYFNDKPIKKASLRTINPQMTGTFEPYQEFVLSDKGGKE